MASKYFKAYKFLTGGKKRPGIVGVKPKSGGAVDEFKSRKLKQLGRTQRKLKSQFKEMDDAIKGAKKRGASRKDIVKGAKVQRDNRRRMREGDKLRKDVLRLGKAMGGGVTGAIDKLKKKGKSEPKKDSIKEKILPKKKKDRLDELRKELGMKKGGPVDKKKKKFPDLTGDGKVTQADILKGRGVFRKGGASK